MTIDPHFRLKEYLSPDTVRNLHGHYQPENYIFNYSFRIFSFFTSFDCNFCFSCYLFFNSLLNVLKPTYRNHKIANIK